MKIKFHAALCTGCRACQMACLDQNDIAPLAQKPLCRVTSKEAPGRVVMQLRRCVHCGLCSGVCPTSCLHRDAHGLIQADAALCVQCRACEAACPQDVISFSPDTGRVQKCDGCVGRVLAGLLPACVHTCPSGALEFSK